MVEAIGAPLGDGEEDPAARGEIGTGRGGGWVERKGPTRVRERRGVGGEGGREEGKGGGGREGEGWGGRW